MPLLCRQPWLVYQGITAGFVAHTTLKLILGFEDISYYLQYNARSEFFSKSTFSPNPECRDQHCINNQKSQKESGISFIENRSKHIASKKKTTGNNYFKEDEVDVQKWQIEVVEDSGKDKEDNYISKEEVDQVNLEDLMSKMNSL